MEEKALPQEETHDPKRLLWKDRKRTFLGLPWSFTRYSLTCEKFTLETGFLSRRTDEVRLYRVRDVSLRRSFGERLLGLGTIAVASSDHTLQDFEIKRVKRSRQVAQALSDLVEDSRRRNFVRTRENLDHHDHDDLELEEWQ
jgi:uncharacterized membrane protein YdbT with pleckstrin-like domain